MFREKLQSEAVTGTSREGLWKLLPTGFGLGGALVGNVVVPYVYAEYQLWSRHLIYRVAADTSAARKVSEADANAAILKEYGKPGAEVVAAKELQTSGEVVWDAEKQRFSLKSVGSASLDMKDLYMPYSATG